MKSTIIPIYMDALTLICPSLQWTISETGYDSLLWHDTTVPKPTRAQFEAAVETARAAESSKKGK